MNAAFSLFPITNSVDISAALTVFNDARASTEGLPSSVLSISEFRVQIEGELILGAELDGELAGFISVWEPENFIHHLFVAPKYQGKGVGSFLIQEIRKRLGTPLRLKCGANNLNARRFYETAGWQKGTTATGPDGPYINYSLLTSTSLP